MRIGLAWIRIHLLSCIARSLIGAACVAFVVMAGGARAADPEARVALVIGIGAYQNAPTLANPVNDAKRISEALRRLNFEVEEQLDPDIRKLTRSLREFGVRAQRADAALVFYAGHGVQVDRENYLLPVDARLERERDLLYEALSLELVLGEVSQAKKVGIVILDACRNNPFVDRLSRSVVIAGRAPASQGLARVDRVPRNTIVAMATKADQIAEDGAGGNSPFTEALLAHLQVPGLELSLFFRSVRDVVLKSTNNRQEPYIFSSLGADPFYFYPRPPNRPPEIGAIAGLQVTDAAGPTVLGLPRPIDPDQDPLSIRIIGLPRGGEVRIGEKVVAVNDVLTVDRFMTATFKPDGSRFGPTGTLDFLIEDGRGASVLGSLPVTVVSSNRVPLVEPARVVRITPSDLGIQSPTDPDGDALTISVTALPAQGLVRNGSAVIRVGDRLRPQELGALTFAPDAGASGDVGALRYTVDDGRGGRSEGTVQIQVGEGGQQIATISESSLWETVARSEDPADAEAFLRLFPTSRWAEQARQRHAVLAARAPPPAPAATAQTEPPRRVAEAQAGSNASAPRSPPAVAALVPPRPAPEPAATTFKDCDSCPTMVRIPAGSFLMGLASGDQSAGPQHRVTIRAFAIGQHPVTVAEWKACVADGGCSFTPRMTSPQDRTPVYNISWDDAQMFLRWISQKTGKSYRLPTEAEWEYAARANTASRYWWGDNAGSSLANCSDCGGRQDARTPLPVGSFKANAFGLHDVHGGVAQWMADCWAPNYAHAPADGSAYDVRNCQKRVLRGGSFRNERTDITAFARNNYDASVRYIAHGMRVARNLD
jgi:formylglycine-generating enzyme required for sulfatase activity